MCQCFLRPARRQGAKGLNCHRRDVVGGRASRRGQDLLEALKAFDDGLSDELAARVTQEHEPQQQVQEREREREREREHSDLLHQEQTPVGGGAGQRPG